jgi:hypothetical protein
LLATLEDGRDERPIVGRSHTLEALHGLESAGGSIADDAAAPRWRRRGGFGRRLSTKDRGWFVAQRANAR